MGCHHLGSKSPSRAINIPPNAATPNTTLPTPAPPPTGLVDRRETSFDLLSEDEPDPEAEAEGLEASLEPEAETEEEAEAEAEESP